MTSYRDYLDRQGVAPGPWVTRPAPVGDARSGETRSEAKGLDPKDEHAVGEAEAPNAIDIHALDERQARARGRK